MLKYNKIKQFLKEMGLSDIQVNLYYFLLFNKSGTINQIKEELNLSYAQTNNNCNLLEKKGLIYSSDTKPKIFYRIEPKLTLRQLIDERYEYYNENIEKIENEINIIESKSGRCLKDIYHFYYTDINLSIEKFYDLIRKSKKEIILSSLPPFFLKKLVPILSEAFINGIKISIYYSTLDFESNMSYLEEITEIFKRLRITIIQTKEKVCENVGFNNMLINNGFILIDDGYFNTIGFKENEIFYIQGFFSKVVVQQTKSIFDAKNVIKKIETKYPESYQNVLDIIQEYNSIKTRDLSMLAGIGGAKLKAILRFLLDEEKIEEIIESAGVGRPGIYYCLVE